MIDERILSRDSKKVSARHNNMMVKIISREKNFFDKIP